MTSMCMVDVKDGVVTLSGEMMNDSCKDECVKMVKDVEGVKSVVNNCTVMPMTEPPTAKDEWLNKNIDDITKEITTIKIGADSGIIHIAGNLTKEQWEKVKNAIDKLNPKGYDTTALTVENKIVPKNIIMRRFLIKTGTFYFPIFSLTIFKISFSKAMVLFSISFPLVIISATNFLSS